MAMWKFQLLPHEKDIVAHGYRMDAVGEAVEREVNDALPYRFRFHKISKVVLILGPGSIQHSLYSEALGVAQKVVPSFSLAEYVAASEPERVAMLRRVIAGEFRWFEQSFADAAFIAKARGRLSWAA